MALAVDLEKGEVQVCIDDAHSTRLNQRVEALLALGPLQEWSEEDRTEATELQTKDGEGSCRDLQNFEHRAYSRMTFDSWVEFRMGPDYPKPRDGEDYLYAKVSRILERVLRQLIQEGDVWKLRTGPAVTMAFQFSEESLEIVRSYKRSNWVKA